jgi:outer membrane cobalamin receptor
MLSPCLAQTIAPQQQQSNLPPVSTTINVTDTVAEDSPSNVIVLTSDSLSELPGFDLDDLVKIIPGFQLYRRSDSLVANPTTQGVSLRGLGSTGASRTLVLWDGIPVNDPFGGWVYWTRLDPEEMQRVEVTASSSTAVFGDRAMGGLMALFSTAARGDSYLQYDYGSFNEQDLRTGMADAWRHWAASMDVRMYTTDGYYILPANLRGSVDQPAGSDWVAGNLRLDYFKGNQRLFLRLDIDAEHRDNGTVDQRNATGLGEIAANYAHTFGNNQISVLGYYTQEAFRATFSSVAAGRDSEKIVDRQTVPAKGAGGAAYWNYSPHRWKLLVGADAERDEGHSTDRLLSGTTVTGGTEFERGAFAQLQFNAGPFSLFGGLRGDLPGVGGGILSPSGGFAVGHHRLRGHGSVWRSFRAPTLNELYRPFQVGNVLTLANPALVPERMFGAEVGGDFVGEKTRIGLNLFRDSLTDLLENATLSDTGTSIRRERMNGPPAISRGIEANASRSWHDFKGQLSYLFVDSHFDASGMRIPEVAKNQGSALVAYKKKDLMLSASLRTYSSQFDDDLNQFLLPGFASLAVAAQQRVSKSISATAEMENILNHQYYVALTPLPNTGEPRVWRLGLRWEQH